MATDFSQINVKTLGSQPFTNTFTGKQENIPSTKLQTTQKSGGLLTGSNLKKIVPSQGIVDALSGKGVTSNAAYSDADVRALQLGTYKPKVDVVNTEVMKPRVETQIPPIIPKATTNNLAVANDTFFSQIDTASQPKVQAPTQKESEKDILRSELDRLRGDISGQSDKVAQFQKEEELIKKQAEATRFKKELQTVDDRYEEEKKKIKENTSGMLQSQVNADLERAYDRYQDRRANVATSYDIAVQDYNSAVSRVDQKAQALKDQLSQEVQAYQLASSAIYNDLTESEKAEVDYQRQLKLQRAKSVEDVYSTIMTNAVLNNAPTSVLSAIDEAARNPNATSASIISAAGNYGTETSIEDKQAQARATKYVSAIQDGSLALKDVPKDDLPYLVEYMAQNNIVDKNTNEKVNNDIDLVSQLNALYVNPALPAATGFFGRFIPSVKTLTGETNDFVKSFEQIKSSLTVGNLGLMTGVLTDRDMQVLQQEATKLDTSLSTDAFKEELKKLSGLITEKILEKPYVDTNTKRQVLTERILLDDPSKSDEDIANEVDLLLEEYITPQSSFKGAGNATVSTIANAIKTVESGGDYNARGGSGEFGAYQFMPSTWKQWAGEFLGNPNAQPTKTNQDIVAQAKIQQLIDQGYNEREIALIWNGGTPKEKKGVNKYGVAYDSGAYADKIISNLNS